MLTLPFVDRQPNQILCYYTNCTQHPQTVRMNHASSGCFERVVQPQQSIVFQAQADCQLEVQSSTTDNFVSNNIPCDRLRASKDILSQLLLRVL
ncbi:DUF1830 domain-containing protein [Kovacikia minuta CCNUW1]|uniref:DUF1830 domain-containing protein n=1 Tax=Kovacikia minuta TaxID=2931930 RepID=UPI001CCD423E|nr:DUF1830 domain-containing protein [Kovacikia minuta]UBF28028.1 DUF1830 domain-containing protein [Kovacikia minuta CCNUW1]